MKVRNLVSPEDQIRYLQQEVFLLRYNAQRSREALRGEIRRLVSGKFSAYRHYTLKTYRG